MSTSNSALLAAPNPRFGLEQWMERHQRFCLRAGAGDIELLFLGDSITDFWRDTGERVWNREFVPLKATNFGITADRIQHVLWRIENGETKGYVPKVVILLIGANDTGPEKNTGKLEIPPKKSFRPSATWSTCCWKMAWHAYLGPGPPSVRKVSGSETQADRAGQRAARTRNGKEGNRVSFLDLGGIFCCRAGDRPASHARPGPSERGGLRDPGARVEESIMNLLTLDVRRTLSWGSCFSLFRSFKINSLLSLRISASLDRGMRARYSGSVRPV